MLFGGILIAAAAATLWGSRASPDGARAAARIDSNLLILIVALALIPLMAFVLGVVATGSFVPRYALGFTLLPGLVLALAVSTIRRAELATLLAVPLVAIGLGAARLPPQRLDHGAVRRWAGPLSAGQQGAGDRRCVPVQLRDQPVLGIPLKPVGVS